MKNDLISKWLLFISSYLPLYFWLLFSNIDFNHINFSNFSQLSFSFPIFFRIMLIILIIMSIFVVRALFIGTGSEVKELPKEMEINPESDSLMNYIVTYFTPLISFDLYDIKSVIMNVSLFILIGLMYVGSSATYLNPVLGVFGFKIFGVTGFPHAHHIISRFSFDEIETIKKRGDQVISYRLGDGIIVIKRKE